MPNVSIERWFLHVLALTSAKGFDLSNNRLVITPTRFAPEILCSCNPGWSLSCKDLDFGWFGSLDLYSSWLSYLLASSWMSVCSMLFSIFFAKQPWATFEQLRNGSGIQCQMCPPDHFKNDTSVDCMPCPEGSTAPHGSTSPESCKCKVGKLVEKNGKWKLDQKRGLTAVRFSCAWCLLVFRWCSNLAGALENGTSALGMSERS